MGKWIIAFALGLLLQNDLCGQVFPINLSFFEKADMLPNVWDCNLSKIEVLALLNREFGCYQSIGIVKAPPVKYQYLQNPLDQFLDQIIISMPLNASDWRWLTKPTPFQLPSKVRALPFWGPSSTDDFVSQEHRPWLSDVFNHGLGYYGTHHPSPYVVYRLDQEPGYNRPYYSGSLICLPHISARAESVVELETQLLKLYCNYIEQLYATDEEVSIEVHMFRMVSRCGVVRD
jgi:hypothetical protein